MADNGNVPAAVQQFTIVIDPAVVSPVFVDSLAPGVAGQPYAADTLKNPEITTGGGYAFSLTSGALPSGLTLNTETGKITGTPSINDTPVTYRFKIKVVYVGNSLTSDYCDLTLAPTPSLSAISEDIPLRSVVGKPYSGSVTFEGALSSEIKPSSSAGMAPFPTWLTFDPATGTFSGTPTSAGAFSFVLVTHGVDGTTRNANYQIYINDEPPVITTTSLPDGVVGQPYDATVKVTGANVQLGLDYFSQLPAGLQFDPATGRIWGIPTKASEHDIKIYASNFGNYDVSKTFHVVINPAPVTPPVKPTPAAPQITSKDQSQTLVKGMFSFKILAAGEGPFTFAAAGLPAGLTLDPATGVISGHPTTPGTYKVTITVTNAAGPTTQTLTLEVLSENVEADPKPAPTAKPHKPETKPVSRPELPIKEAPQPSTPIKAEAPALAVTGASHLLPLTLTGFMLVLAGLTLATRTRRRA